MDRAADSAAAVPADTHRVRVEHEARLLAEGRAELDAGLGLDLDTVEAWLDRVYEDKRSTKRHKLALLFEELPECLLKLITQTEINLSIVRSDKKI